MAKSQNSTYQGRVINDISQQRDWDAESSQTQWSLQAGPVINKQNKSVYLSVVWILGIIAIFALVGVVGLSFVNKEIPQALIAIGSVAVGALGSLFTRSK